MEVRRHLDMVLPQDLRDLSSAFDRAGFRLYVVGGAVRDALMGQVPKDYDVATDATPDQVIELLRPIEGWQVIEVGKAFGVVRARHEAFGLLELSPGDHEYEIATFRTDVGEGRRPEAVVFTTIEEDVKRRDLTVNALFYDIAQGEVVDLVGGLADIEVRIIRTIGNPVDRFREDRLRVLRALRFAARFHWPLEAETVIAITEDNNLDGVSGERIRDEFIKGVASSRFVRHFLKLLDEFGMWGRVFPGLSVAMSPDVMVSSSGIESRVLPVVLAVLLDGNPVPTVARRLNELKYTAQEVAQVTFLMRFRDLGLENAYRLRRQFNGLRMDDDVLVEYCGERGMPDLNLLRAFINYELTVTGDALLKRGLSGAELGRELERLETIEFQRLLDDRPRLSLRSLEELNDRDSDD
jgi:tRNA nucleotidyltransferase/poly(A) polymerase